MIISFGSKSTEKIWEGVRIKHIPIEIQYIGRRRLIMLNNSQNILDLRIPPLNRPEKLTGKMSEFYSVNINNKWRIIFKWENDNAYELEIVDYQLINNKWTSYQTFTPVKY